MLLVLKYKDPLTLLFLNPTYFTALLYGLRLLDPLNKWIVILQKNAVRIMNFQLINFHTSSIFKQSSILKFQDKICLENILFVSKSM